MHAAVQLLLRAELDSYHNYIGHARVHHSYLIRLAVRPHRLADVLPTTVSNVNYASFFSRLTNRRAVAAAY